MLLAKEQKRRTSQGGSTFCLPLTLLITHLTDLNLINSSSLQLCNRKLMPACSTLLSLASLLLLYIYKYN